MAFSPNVWNQIKGITKDEFIKALKRDGFEAEGKRGAVLAFCKKSSPVRRVTVHYHPGATYQPKLLTSMIESAGWTEDDLRRLKLIK